MERQRLIDTDKYLERVENTDLNFKGDLRELLSRLDKPFEAVGEYAKEGGMVTAHWENNELELRYSELSENGQSDVEMLFQHLKQQKGTSESWLKPEGWHTVTSLVLRTEGGVVDLLDIAPNLFRLYFCPDTTEQQGTVFQELPPRIFIMGNILTPRGLATLMHEIGHICDQENLDKERTGQFVTKGWNDDKAEKIRRERAATAFAIREMKPYMGKDLKEDVVAFLKYYALNSYYQIAKRELSTQRALAHMAKDYLDDDVGDSMGRATDFWYWKDTLAYTKWKALPEFKDLPVWEEYSAWEQWCIENEYDYFKDLPSRRPR